MPTTQQNLQIEAQRKKDNRRTPLLKKCPHARGWVNRATIVTPRKPNSAKRPVVKIFLRKGRRMTAHIPGIGHNLKKFTKVLTRGKGPRDLPGVRYSCVRGALDFVGLKKKKRRRSIYGAPQNDMSKIRARRKYRHAIRKAENTRIFEEKFELQNESYGKKFRKINLYNKKFSRKEERTTISLLIKRILICFKNIILFNYFKPLSFERQYIKEIQESKFFINEFKASEEFFQIVKKDNYFLHRVFSLFFFIVSDSFFFLKNLNYILFFSLKNPFYKDTKIKVSLFNKFLLSTSLKKKNYQILFLSIQGWFSPENLYKSGLYKISPIFLLSKKKPKKHYVLKPRNFLSKKETIANLSYVDKKYKNIKKKKIKKAALVNYLMYYKIFKNIKKKYIFEKTNFFKNRNVYNIFNHNNKKRKFLNVTRYLYFYFFKPLDFYKKNKKHLIMYNNFFDFKFILNYTKKALFKYIRFSLNKKVKKVNNFFYFKRKKIFSEKSNKRFYNKLKNL